MRMKSSTPLEDLIREELEKTGGNISAVARRLGLSFEGLLARYGGKGVSGAFKIQVEEPKDIRELARPGLEGFVVAVKRAGAAWPEKYKGAIEKARRKYDAGTHEMCQGRKDGWVILYLIPRIIPVRPRDYFSSMVLA